MVLPNQDHPRGSRFVMASCFARTAVDDMDPRFCLAEGVSVLAQREMEKRRSSLV